MPSTLSTDEDDNWEGTVTTIKKAIATSTVQVKNAMQKKILNLQQEVNVSTERLSRLDEKVSDLHSSQDRLNTKLKALDQKMPTID